MANTVFKLRRSSVAGKVPNTSALGIGELAINLTDRKLFSTDGTTVFETGANLTTLTVSTNTSVNNIIITGSVQANGGIGTNGQILISNGSSVYWGLPSSNGILDVRQQYTGNGSQNTFVVTGGYRNNDLSVFLNGTMLRNGVDVNVTDGSTVKFTTAPVNGSLIDVVGVGTLYANGISSTTSQQFTANGTANSFTISGGYVPSQIQVYLNGVKQVPGTDVIITSGNTVNFINTPGNNYIVDVFGYQTSLYTYVNTDAQYTWTNTQTFSNTITFNSTIVGTVNNALYLGGTVASGYQTTAGLSANVATLTSNNTSYVGTVTAANVVSNAQLVANLANYALLSGGLFTGSVNATSYNVGTAFTANSTLTNTASLSVSTNNLTIGTSSYFVSNGNVGIGISTPTFPLHVNTVIGEVRVQGNVFTKFSMRNTGAAVDSKAWQWVSDTSSNSLYLGILNDAENAQNLAIQIFRGASYTTNNINIGCNTVSIGTGTYFVSNGNVGIANTSPADKLSINGTTYFGGNISSAINLSANTSGIYTTGVVNATSYNVGTAFTANSTLTNTASLVVSTNTATIGTGTYFVSNGNVGIGYSNPVQKLAVVGNTFSVSAAGNIGAPGATEISSGVGSPVSSRFAFGTDGTGWQFRLSKNQANTYTDYITVTDGGNIGIGNTAPTTKLVIQSALPATSYETDLVINNPNTSGGQSTMSVLFGGIVKSRIRTDYVGNLVLSALNGSMLYGYDTSNSSGTVHNFYANNSTLSAFISGANHFYLQGYYYDNANTSYYVKPSQTSQFNALQLASGISVNTLGYNGQYMAVAGSASTWYNTMWRNDGGVCYLLQSAAQTTAAGAVNASWNTYRPLQWNLSTGNVTINGDGATSCYFGLHTYTSGTIFDNTNTAYYVKPSLTSVLNTLQFNNGYGSAATAYGCRAWVNFNGVSGTTIRSSGGVTSVTRNATGDYTVNLNFTMPDINYTVNVSKSTGYGVSFVGDTMVHTVLSTNAEQAPTTTAFRFGICVWNASTTGVDGKYISVLVFR